MTVAPAVGVVSRTDDVLELLSNLSDKDVHALLAGLDTAVGERAAEVKTRLSARAKAEPAHRQDGAESEADGKFSNLSEAAYGDVADFHRGLEVVGTPHPQARDQMHKEHTQKADSQQEFEAWNSGKNVTTPQKEWDFVVEPFFSVSVCAGTSPADWTRKHVDYGGSRAPIRLQVFNHATSATLVTERGDVTFGNYNCADALEDSDPLWLHKDEVGLVKVVVLRHVKSQLDGVSLRAALAKKNIDVQVKAAEHRADKIVQVLSTYLHETDGSASRSTFDGVVEAFDKKKAASVAEVEALIDYFHAKLARQKIKKPEVIAMRMYTGPG